MEIEEGAHLKYATVASAQQMCQPHNLSCTNVAACIL